MNILRSTRFFTGPALALSALLLLNSCGSRFFWKGLRMYERERYADAAAGFEKALAQWPNDTMSWRLLGKTQMLMVDYVAAEKTFEELGYRTALNMEDRVNWAKCMMNQEKYAEASDVLESIMLNESTPPYAQKIWSQCQNQLYVEQDDRHWEISPLRFPGLETASAPHITGDKLYFSSEPFRWGQTDHTARLDRNQMWALDLKPGHLHTMKARDVVEWNLPEHDGMVCLSPDGKAIAYSKKNGNGIGWFGDAQEGGYQLMVAQRLSTGDWGEARPFPFVEKGYVFAHPTFSADGKRMYFSTDLPSPEAQGGMDLWVSERNGTFWEEPLNLGPEVNSPGDDVFPAFDASGRLYFASDGHPTLGGLDVFWTEIDTEVLPESRHWRDGDAWTEPVRLRFPINTMADDFGLVMEPDAVHGFVCSNRSGVDEIFRIESTPSTVPFAIHITDYSTGSAIPRVPIRWIDLRDGSAWQTRTELDGTLLLDLPPNRAYSVICEMPGYITERTVLTTETSQPVWDVQLAKIKTLNDERYAAKWMGGTPFELAGIEWDPSNALDRKSQFTLYDLADFLKLNPDVFLEVRTHEDASSWDLFDQPNNRVSKNRAIEIESFLLKVGVSSKQLICVGKGIDELRNKCLPGQPCASYNHAENDRTEFRIYGLLQQTPGQIDPEPFTKAFREER